MRRILLGLCVLFFLNAHGQEIPLPEKMPQDHPRVLTTPEGKKETWKLIKKEAWAQDVFNKLKERTEVYTRRTESQPDWLLSRLAMYWKSHATEVYVKGRPCRRREGTCPDSSLYRNTRDGRYARST